MSASRARADGLGRPELAKLAQERRALREARKRLDPPLVVPPDGRMKFGPIDMAMFEPKPRSLSTGPRLDGFAVCRRIRAQADTPVILLTVRGEEDDIVSGLGLGADDYITKPFDADDLHARIRSALRARTPPTPSTNSWHSRISRPRT